MVLIRRRAPAALRPLVEYFDQNYVTGTHGRRRVIPPPWPKEEWNVYHITLNDEHRTNNMCGTWHNAFAHLAIATLPYGP